MAANQFDPQLGPFAFRWVQAATQVVCLVTGVIFALRARSVTRVIQDGFMFFLIFECFAVSWFQPWYATWLLPLAMASRSSKLQWIAAIYTATVTLLYLPNSGGYIALVLVQVVPLLMLARDSAPLSHGGVFGSTLWAFERRSQQSQAA